MKIRQQLLAAFGLLMLLALVPSILSYRELSSVRKRLKPVELATDITKVFLEVRKNEKTFLLLKDPNSLQLLQKQMGMLKVNIEDLETDILREIGSRNYSALHEAIAAYGKGVKDLADNFRSQQLEINSLTELGREIENDLSGDALNTFLILRRYEKNLLIYRDSSSMDKFRQTMTLMPAPLTAMLKKYSDGANRLYAYFQGEESLEAELLKTGSEIQNYTDSILQSEREDIDALIRYSMNLLLLSLVAVIVMGAFLSGRLASGIHASIKKIRLFAERVASGDFSETLEVSGAREFGSLAEALNSMSLKLKETVSSLELAITNLHEKQGQLVEAEKLASLGRLAAGVAHEINNPLAIINEKAGLMQDLLVLTPDFEQKKNFHAQIEGITGSVNRCRTITHRLLGFARRIEITIEPMNLNDAIRETITFLKSDIFTKSARLELNLADDLPEVRSDKLQLEQVLLNLIKNAVDAISEGGQITVTTSRKDENTVQVFISDNGSGISKDQAKHVFEPFFTTKERDRGTGLGLFVSHAILRKLGCSIRLQSEPGRGTTFSIDVPLRPAPAEKKA